MTINLGTGNLKSTLQDNMAYEIGTDTSGKALADGSLLDVPKGVTVIFDAGAVVKLRNANIYVGSSSQNVDHSLGSVQVLGIPDESVYFTSYWDAHVGHAQYTTQAPPAAAAGDWGGLVFNNAYDYQEGRTVLETAGIFLDYVSNANMSYGGGKINVNGVVDTYDPIHMIEARPTVRSPRSPAAPTPRCRPIPTAWKNPNSTIRWTAAFRAARTTIRTITPASAPTCAATR